MMTEIQNKSQLAERIPLDLLGSIIERLREARKVQILGHLRPDGDCIGSLLSMSLLLEKLGAETRMAAADHTYAGYRMIPGYDRIETAPSEDFGADLTIFVDCADRARAFPNWNAEGTIINIDHHRSNNGFGDLNWIDPASAATGEMIYYLYLAIGEEISKDAATALLLAIMTDTGCLRYASVRPEHFEICGDLVRKHGDLQLISRAAYESNPPISVQFGAAILSRAHFEADGAFSWGEATRELIEKYGGETSLPENLVNDLRSIDGVETAILFIERSGGGLRASFRGQGAIDVSRLAGEFGGGGHPNAAGLTIESGEYRTLRDQVIARALELLQQSAKSQARQP